MTRYYAIRPNKDAWGTSVVIHAWIIALLLFIPAIKPLVDEPLTEPLEITLLDAGPSGDMAHGEDSAPAPKPATLARVREVPPRRTVTEPKPAAVQQAPVPASPPQQAAPPVEQQVQEPDAAAIEAEAARRKAVEEQSRRAAEEQGTQTAYNGSGTSDSPPPPGGAVGAGKGATGNLSGRRAVATFKPPYPAAAAARHAEGVVLARIRVSPDGQVENVDIVRSAGDPDIDQAAQSAFRRWRFSPLPDGAPAIDQVGDVKMTFELQ